MKRRKLRPWVLSVLSIVCAVSLMMASADYEVVDFTHVGIQLLSATIFAGSGYLLVTRGALEEDDLD